MYCTVLGEPVSTGLDDDANTAYYRFGMRARTLGRISRTFDPLAAGVTDAYHAALTEPDRAAWTVLVSRAASLVQRARELREIVGFDAAEIDALTFFEAIVNENADLLGAHATGHGEYLSGVSSSD